MIIQELIQFFEDIAPSHFQESYDNAGLLTGHATMEIKGVLTCLDATEAVIEEALSLRCNVIVAHHPIIFRGLKKINGNNYVERVIIKAIKNDIAIFAIHTNLDNVYFHGVNTTIAARIGLIDVAILAPQKGIIHHQKPIGAGVVGNLPIPMGEIDFLAHLKQSMNLTHLKRTKLLSKTIQRVALCGGSGSFLIQAAIESNASVFISSDFKYHEFFDAEDKIMIADIGHFESEQFTIEYLKTLLIENFSIFAVHSTKINTNPVLYS